jgi:outer membrane lipoprotein carrier protein
MHMKLDKKGLHALVALLLVLFSISRVFANEGIDQFKTFLSAVENAEGDFSQQQIRPPRKGEDKPKILRKSQGHFIFQRPGKFVWETLKPFEQKVIADGEKITLWDKDLNQVTIRPAGQSLQSTPAAILFGGVAIEERFELLAGEEKGGMSWFELNPKVQMGGEQPYSRIGIGMSNGVPAGIELHDNFGNVILITLSKIRVNASLGSQTFKFVPPAGADVLKVQ